MKYLNEFRDPDAVAAVLKRIERRLTGHWQIMEVCGGQTHSIMKYGLDQLLPAGIELIHGPGCPVCVTPAEILDAAIDLAITHRVIVCSYGDMLRVPGSKRSLLDARAEGADIRLIYSPMEAVALAQENPQCEIVFLAVGFETTSAVNAQALRTAAGADVKNFSMLVSQVTVPAALEMISRQPDCAIDGFLAAGHVCTVMGTAEYEPLAKSLGKPIVITGFEPVDILLGVESAVDMLESGRAEVINKFQRVVAAPGNRVAQEGIFSVFERIDKSWRGLGVIPDSGLGIRREFEQYDAERKFGVTGVGDTLASDCQSGLVLQGLIKPHECDAFGVACTPETPLGAPMVSEEGACSAWFRYRHLERP
ncbi:Hydrogenase maturation factor HypD [BD1-7 clade bacterium]|uniref:Hydrogenase maturation factor n=1 Tax=BD1-7 clade bacterium TaxID=2029982 RepID=A0A5S9QP25_9GAMM|nr:Hydrogenase maturation factor HypD [BD1-7 clade bacterium]